MRDGGLETRGPEVSPGDLGRGRRSSCFTAWRSVRDLNAKIRAFIDGWNDRAHPVVWTKTADEILKKANRKNTSNAGH